MASSGRVCIRLRRLTENNDADGHVAQASADGAQAVAAAVSGRRQLVRDLLQHRTAELLVLAKRKNKKTHQPQVAPVSTEVRGNCVIMLKRAYV